MAEAEYSPENAASYTGLSEGCEAWTGRRVATPLVSKMYVCLLHWCEV